LALLTLSDTWGGEKASLSKLSELNIFNDREAKPLSIGLHIRRRPLLAFGNSDGDLAMMRYATMPAIIEPYSGGSGVTHVFS
jgi:hypothetical protein